MKSDVSELALNRFEDWYNELKVHKVSEGPARGTIAAALLILDKLQNDFNLDLDSYRTEKGQSQIAGLSAAAIAGILERFGEKRPFLSEGGRTNRGAAGDMAKMLNTIANMELSKLSKNKRNSILQSFQLFLVKKIEDFHNRQILKVHYDPSTTTLHFISEILQVAKNRGKDGKVAQYLVGAKLQMRYPEIEIENYSSSTADQQLNRRGDFQVNDTVFHISVSPMQPVYEKCKSNVEEGFRAYLLVPDKRLAGAKDYAEALLSGKIFVQSIDAFVAQNVEELSSFSKGKIAGEFHQLLSIYNSRVDAIESDKSLLIEIPANMKA
jgi:hypothetical protein